MMRAAKLGIAVSMMLAMSLPALAAKQLPPDDIKAQFGNGTPFSGVAVPGGRKYSLTLNADGTAQMTLLNDKSNRTGTWRVSKTGYCTKWGDKPEHCYKVQQSGSRYDVLDASGKVIAHWTKA
jgi:hypothetical protein